MNITLEKFADLAALVEGQAPLADSLDHGTSHWRAVARTGLELCSRTPDADPRLILLFALLHDSRRVNEFADPDHGPEAARYLTTLRKEGIINLSNEDSTTLAYAMYHHDAGETSDDLTIAACWDADRLQLQRLGYWLKNELLSNPLSHTLEVQELVSSYHESDELSWGDLFIQAQALCSR